MTSREAVKISPYDVEPQVLAHRKNYKLVDPTTVGSEHVTFGMVVVEPGGICEPGHSHDDQEEVLFGLSGRGIVTVGDDRQDLEIGPKDAIYVPKNVYHLVKNPSNIPFELLWILAPAGWVFDVHPDWEAKARKGEPLDAQ